ncbi:MAG: HEAT repeat domain-containing protein [Armatimonadetes bacterium]|nr:HEAT repeat domain-containing protein [Armatimonadota bacterium]
MQKVVLLFLALGLMGSSLALAESSAPDWRADVAALADDARQSAAFHRIRQLLQGKPPPGLVPALVDALRTHAEYKVRLRAASSLGYARDDRARIALGESLAGDPNPYVRDLSAFALALHGSAAIPLLRRGMFDNSPRVQHRSMESMVRVGENGIPEVLSRIEHLQKANSYAGFLILDTLSCARDRRVADFFLRQANHPDALFRRHLVEAMGGLAWDPSYTPPPGQPYIGMSDFPVEKGYRITSRERQALIQALRRATRDPDEEVRDEAERALALVIRKVLVPRKRKENANGALP